MHAESDIVTSNEEAITGDEGGKILGKTWLNHYCDVMHAQ